MKGFSAETSKSSEESRSFDVNIASKENAAKIAVLFNDYRIFYKQPSDINLALKFISDRITKNESTIIYVIDKNEKQILGLVPLFKVAVRWVLNN